MDLHQRQNFEESCAVTEIPDAGYGSGQVEGREKVEKGIDLFTLRSVRHDIDLSLLLQVNSTRFRRPNGGGTSTGSIKRRD